MIGIIGAMDIEVEKLSGLLENVQNENVSGINFLKGEIGSTEIRYIVAPGTLSRTPSITFL